MRLTLLSTAAIAGCAGYAGVARAPYDPGRPLPSPELFLPELVSQPDVSRGYLSFTPDGRTFYLIRYEGGGA